jgi:hypothetical protein
VATDSVTSGDVRLLVVRGAVGVVMVAHGYNHISCVVEWLRIPISAALTLSAVRGGERTWIRYFASKALVTRLSDVATFAV